MLCALVEEAFKLNYFMIFISQNLTNNRDNEFYVKVSDSE